MADLKMSLVVIREDWFIRLGKMGSAIMRVLEDTAVLLGGRDIMVGADLVVLVVIMDIMDNQGKERCMMVV